jgi:hypothetical protein
MDYCRFENTERDLRDCRDALVEKGIGKLSGDERRAFYRMVALCREMVDLAERDSWGGVRVVMRDDIPPDALVVVGGDDYIVVKNVGGK